MCYAGAVPRFLPFTGLRYAPSVPLERVIAPPYDVVDHRQRHILAARHPANAIHVELPEAGREGADRYVTAAAIFQGWRAAGTLVQDERPSFSVLQMATPDGTVTNGVIGALDCDPGSGDVLPHEQTVPKDTTDRLDLLRACQANLSPIWGLSLTEGLGRLVRPDGPPDTEAVDDDGVSHRLWVVDDPGTMEAITAAVGSSPVVIADGHHRLQTAATFRSEQRAVRHGAGGPWDFVMALVTELAAGELVVGPIHRTLTAPTPDVDVVSAFDRWFELIHAGPTHEAVLTAVGASRSLALVTADDVWLLAPRPETTATTRSDLDASVVALALGSIPGAEVAYHHRWRSAIAEVTSGRAGAAILVRPVTVDQIAAWAHARRRMPPKSTYFSPKPRTGMVFRSVVG